jgi:predicted nuclease with TOPRIM domain
MWISKEKHQELIDKYNKLSLEHYNVGANFTQMYNKNIKLELEIKRLTEENTRLGRTNNELANQYKDAYKRIQELESKTKIHIIYVPEPLPEKQKEEKIVIEPTYFTMNENRQCFDLCEIINDGTKIGSRFCCECN